MEPSGVERLLMDLGALADEVDAGFIEPEPITDVRGRVWTWWKGDLWRHDRSVVPRPLLRKLCEEA